MVPSGCLWRSQLVFQYQDIIDSVFAPAQTIRSSRRAMKRMLRLGIRLDVVNKTNLV